MRRSTLQALNGLTRAVLGKISDATKLQTLDFKALHQESFEQIEHWHPFGFFSVPLPGAEAIVGFLNGNREHPAVLAVSDRRYRPKDSKPGDTGIHDSRGQVMHFGDGGIAFTSGKTLVASIDGIEFTIGDGKISTNVNIETSADVIAGGVSLRNHVNTGVVHGGEVSGPPA